MLAQPLISLLPERSLLFSKAPPLAAAMSGFFRRLAAIPWRNIAGDAFSRTFLMVKAFCVIHVIDEHVCSLSLVRGPSMLPAMNLAGDVVAVDKVSVRRGKVRPGDVVLLISPEDPRKVVANRVHGLEGETVTYFIDPGNSSASKTVVVPQGHVWVQGDNPYASRDSRQFGSVPYGLITGKVFCRVWPPERFGSIDSDAQEIC